MQYLFSVWSSVHSVSIQKTCKPICVICIWFCIVSIDPRLVIFAYLQAKKCIFSTQTLCNNSHDNVYGAVIITKVIARVRPVHLMNVDWAPGGRQPSDQANRLGLWVRRKLAAVVYIHHRHCYYYSARKLILILPSHGGWKAEST